MGPGRGGGGDGRRGGDDPAPGHPGRPLGHGPGSAASDRARASPTVGSPVPRRPPAGRRRGRVLADRPQRLPGRPRSGRSPHHLGELRDDPRAADAVGGLGAVRLAAVLDHARPRTSHDQPAHETGGGRPVRPGGGVDGPAAPPPVARGGDHGPDRLVRRFDRDLQHHLPGAGPRGRRADERGRRRSGDQRDDHGPAAIEPVPSPAAPRSGGGTADAAPVRLRGKRPPGPVRDRSGDDRPGHADVGCLLRRGQRFAGPGHAPGPSGWSPGVGRDRSRFPASPGRPSSAATPVCERSPVPRGPVPLRGDRA